MEDRLANLRQQVDILKKARKYAEAVNLLKEIQEEYPKESWGFYEDAFIILRRLKHESKYMEAVQVAEAGLSIDPDNVFLKRILAEALSRINGQEDRADSLFQELISTTTGDEKVKLAIIYADFLKRRGSSAKIEQIYKSLEQAPRSYRAQRHLAEHYQYTDTELAEKYFKEAWQSA